MIIELAAPAMLAVTLAGQAAGLPETRTEALACLALNVYYEARSEGREGQAAVAHVTLNRAKAEGFPDRVCEVVTEGAGESCQFSWWCDGKPDDPENPEAFERAAAVAARAMAGASRDPTGGATYFISTGIEPPAWTAKMRETALIEGHRFYAPK